MNDNKSQLSTQRYSNEGIAPVRHLITAAMLWILLLACGSTAAVDVAPEKLTLLIEHKALQRLPLDATPKGATLQQVIDHPAFATVTAPILPATRTDVWYRAPLTNTRDAPTQIILDFTEMLIDEIEFYSNLNGTWQATLTGLKHPYASRALDYPYFAFPLELPAHYNGYVYFRVNSAHLPAVSPALYGTQLLHQEYLVHHGTSLLFIGILAGVIVVMSMNIVTLRELRLFALVALLAGTLVNIAYSNGFIFKLLPKYTELHRGIYIYTITFTNIMLAQLCVSLFELRQKRVWLYGVSLLLQLACVAVSIATLATDPAPYIQVINVLVILVLLFAFFVGIDAQLRRAPSAALFNAGLFSWLAVTLYTILGVNGIVYFGFWSRHAHEVGMLILCAFFSLAIIDRMRYYRRQHDELLQKAAIAETREHLKSEFLAAMSHEIRTPINGVLGMAQLLTHTEQTTTQRYYTDIIISSGKTLINVLNDILDLSKVEAGKLRLLNESVDLGQLMTSVATITSAFPDKKLIEYSYRIDPAAPVFIFSDSSRLQQLLTNLVSNALKFTEEGSVALRIDLAASQDNLPTGQTRLRFSVRDTGVGIEPDMCRELFNPYVQIELHKPSRYRGTGLGLSICKRLVELMHGDIGVNSTPGEGSEFWFELPVQIDTTRQSEFEQNVARLHDKHLVIANAPADRMAPLIHHLNYFRIRVTSLDIRRVDDIPACDILVWIPSANAANFSDVEKYCATHEQPCVLMTNVQLTENLADSHITPKILTLLAPAGISQHIAAFVAALTNTQRNEAPTVQPATTALGFHVLVAEDNEVNQLIITTMLQRLGASWRLAKDGREAVTLRAQNNDFNIVLMDCEMPVMDGYEAATVMRQWEADNGRPPIPIIALTAHALPEYIERCYASGMDRVLTKPLDINELANTLNLTNQK